MALTPKQRRFVDEYLVDLNATQAAIRAGYSAKTAASIGQENLIKPEILAGIEKGQKANQIRNQRTIDDVLADLREIAKNAMQVVFDKDGNKVMVNHQAAIKAIELEGKHYGGFVGKQQVDLKVTGGLIAPDQYETAEEWQKSVDG